MLITAMIDAPMHKTKGIAVCTPLIAADITLNSLPLVWKKNQSNCQLIEVRLV